MFRFATGVVPNMVHSRTTVVAWLFRSEKLETLAEVGLEIMTGPALWFRSKRWCFWSVFLDLSWSFILTKPKWDQILSAFKLGEIISCYRGFQMDRSSLHLWVGAALYSCKSEQILETKEQEKWSNIFKSYWITFVCILVLFDLNGCRAIVESHMLPDGLLGRLCCGNAGSRLALFIGCFMGQTKMPWKIGRAVVVYPS